jgi:putative copper export protein
MISGRNLVRAIIASALVSIPMAVASQTVVLVDGSWSDLVSHPGFWIYFARACGWYFLGGIAASVLTLFFTSKKQPQAL